MDQLPIAAGFAACFIEAVFSVSLIMKFAMDFFLSFFLSLSLLLWLWLYCRFSKRTRSVHTIPSLGSSLQTTTTITKTTYTLMISKTIHAGPPPYNALHFRLRVRSLGTTGRADGHIVHRPLGTMSVPLALCPSALLFVRVGGFFGLSFFLTLLFPSQLFLGWQLCMLAASIACHVRR